MMFSNFQFTSWLAPVAGHLHFLFVAVFAVGLLFFVYWALKYMKKEALVKCGVWMLIVGIIGMLISAPFGDFWFRGMMGGYGKGYTGIMGNHEFAKMMGVNGFKCLQDKECANYMKGMEKWMKKNGQN